MQAYRLYSLSPDSGHITAAEEMLAPDDAAAIDAARGRGHAVPLELWSGPRKIAHLDAPPEAAAFRPGPLGAALG